jgi:hypothetical protein
MRTLTFSSLTTQLVVFFKKVNEVEVEGIRAECCGLPPSGGYHNISLVRVFDTRLER